MFGRSGILCSAAAVIVGLNAIPAQATPVVFYNDVTTDSYNTGQCFPVYGTSVSSTGPYSAASEFTSLATGGVTDISVMLDYHSPYGTGGFTLQVWNASSSGPSTLLWTSSGYTVPTVYPTGTLVDVSVTGLTLTAGQEYFVVVDASTPTSDIDFHTNVIGPTGYTYYQTSSSSGWTLWSSGNLGAFEVLANTASAVPEPSSLLLFGAGLLGVFGALRSKLMA